MHWPPTTAFFRTGTSRSGVEGSVLAMDMDLVYVY